jgi:TRAP transporter TAXI family solute receptor
MLKYGGWKRRLTAAVAGVAAAGVIAISDASAREETEIRVMVSPEGSGPYHAWATLQTYAKDFHPWLRIVAEETPGFTYNVKYAATQPSIWKNTAFGSGEVVEWAAQEGVKPFFPKPLDVVEDFRFIGTMSQTNNIWVTTNPNIKTPEDFKDKKVAIGLLTQNEWGMHQRMLLDYWGITPELASLDTLGSVPNIDALLDGRADIGTLVVHSATGFSHNRESGPFKTLQAAQRPWYYINVPASMIQRYIDETGAPFMIRELPANTISNQPEAFTTFGNNMTLTVHKDFPEDLAYELTKLWMEMGPKIAEYSAISRIWNPETMSSIARTRPEKVHPGAMRAYRELGLVD